ncbi:MAG: arylsulfatase [Planctomycetes bacterium]|nr:arylsulfatase [Planctomycetota bacterium]
MLPLFLFAALLILSGIAMPADAQRSRLPNVIFLMADDMGYGDLGCYNAKSKVPTPNMDRLAKAGMRFTDAHTPSSVCTPTRYGVLTGRYAWRTRLKRGVLWGYSRALIDTKRLTVASLMKNCGYRTACVGKWHLGLGSAKKTDYSKPLHPCPNDYGFDYFFGIPASLDMQPYVFIENDRALADPTLTIKGSGQARRGGKGFWRGGPIAPGFRHIDVLPRITEKATAFIERHAKMHSDKPFFLYFPLSAPHTPWLPTQPFRGKSEAGGYGDFVTQVDDTVGRVMKTLDRLKLADNTLFILTSDNGAHWTPGDIRKFAHRANHFLRGQKADAWEGGHRVPFIVRWPGVVKPNSVSDQTVCLTDLMATLAALTNTPLPDNAGEDSFSILSVLRGERSKQPVRTAVVHHSLAGVFAIRKGTWKLILGRGSGGFSKPRRIKPKPGEPTGQLYDLAQDPSETKNVYLDHPQVVRALSSLLQRYQKSGRSRTLSNR